MLSEDAQYWLLFIIVELFFLLFATGLAVPSGTTANSIIIT